MAREIAMAEAVIDYPEPPFVALIGGVSLEQKLPLLEQLLPKVNRLFVGGALCFPFLKERGQEVGSAPVDEEFLPLIKPLLANAAGKVEVILPVDFLVVSSKDWQRFEDEGRRSSPPPFQTVPAAELLPSHLPVDVGPMTLRRIEALIGQAGTLLWNGPLGVWEIEPFGSGTRETAWQIVTRRPAGLRAILRGDSLARALRSFDLPAERIRPITAASQATLQLLAGRPLPAVEALMKEADLALPGRARSRRIVLTVDGSERSLEVLRKVISLLDPSGAEVHLVFVQKRPRLALADTRGDAEQRRRRAIQRQLEAERVFALAAGVLTRHGIIPRRQIVLDGDPAECMLNYAGEIGADLVAAERPGLDPAKCGVLLVRVRDAEIAPAARERD
jgi:nucleotide-binding universal stress UspA family protein